MITVNLDGKQILVNILKKRNKNTYFYFKKDGHIEVRLSKYHTEKYIINHIKKNSTSFLLKLEKASKTKVVDDSLYYYFGTPFQKVISDSFTEISFTDQEIHLPMNHTDQLKRFEKRQVLEVLHELQQKHINNHYVDIKNVNVKTRYTTTRFGSCNAVKKNINISTHLVHYDKRYIEYVFLHEIAHLNHQNHGQKFYQLLDKLCPNHRQLKQELREQFR